MLRGKESRAAAGSATATLKEARETRHQNMHERLNTEERQRALPAKELCPWIVDRKSRKTHASDGNKRDSFQEQNRWLYSAGRRVKWRQKQQRMTSLYGSGLGDSQPNPIAA